MSYVITMRVASAFFLMFTVAAFADDATFKVTSSDISSEKSLSSDFVFNSFGCTGKNNSPQLQWSGAPAGTQSFAVTMFDSDAPTGSGWWHWVALNIPATTNSLPRGVGTREGGDLPAGTQQINTDFGVPGYGGPCPPAGDKPHRYTITVYALKVPRIELPATATAAAASGRLNANALAKASLTFNHGR